MNLFETVKSAVTVKQAAEYYGCKVNRGDMICCPFHDDRHPSMKLNRDYFYCFGCGATGDVIDFVARLFGLSSYEAAKKLAYDFGIDPDKPPAAMALKKPYPLAQAFRNDEIHCQRVLCDYLHLLERWKVEYAPQSPEDELDDRFVEACHMIEYIRGLKSAISRPITSAQRKSTPVIPMWIPAEASTTSIWSNRPASTGPSQRGKLPLPDAVPGKTVSV